MLSMVFIFNFIKLYKLYSQGYFLIREYLIIFNATDILY